MSEPRQRTEICPRCGNFKDVDEDYCSEECAAEARRAAQQRQPPAKSWGFYGWNERGKP